MKITKPLAFKDEGDMFKFLDQHMNANGIEPSLAGLDNDDIPFIAWLDEDGGDSVTLRVLRLDGSNSAEVCLPSEIQTPSQGQTSTLVYPVTVLERVVVRIKESDQR